MLVLPAVPNGQHFIFSEMTKGLTLYNHTELINVIKIITPEWLASAKWSSEWLYSTCSWWLSHFQNSTLSTWSRRVAALSYVTWWVLALCPWQFTSAQNWIKCRNKSKALIQTWTPHPPTPKCTINKWVLFFLTPKCGQCWGVVNYM